ncbi:MAG TPA: aldose epimerase family protein [Nocardioidaceae bacterium]
MTDSRVTKARTEPFGLTGSGQPVERIRLRSEQVQVDVITYGARVTSVLAPDQDGVLDEVILGLADVAAYEADRNYLGATIGRYANRIADGRFELDGHRFDIPANEGSNALHGGTRGFDSMLWEAEVGEGAEVRLSRVSDDGEMGFPGRLEVTVTYRLDGPDLRVSYDARTSAPTVVNLTNHMYVNLAGGGSVEDHLIQVDAEAFLPIDDHAIPTGEVRRVEGTPFDLRSPVRIGDRLRAADEQLRRALGYDHTFVLGPVSDEETISAERQMRRAARLEEPASGRGLELWTDRPGVQVYTGNHLDGTTIGRDGTTYRQTDACCLEPQHFPDAPNHPAFPSTVLRPGDVYRARDVYRFTTDR